MRWLNVLVIFATFISYCSPYFSPEKFWLFSLFGLAYPWLLMANILLILFWGIIKEKYFLLSLCCIIMGWTHVKSLFGFQTATASTSEKTIKLMSYNMHNLRYLSLIKKEQKRRVKEFNDWITFLDPSIICTQENILRVETALNNYTYKYGKHPTRATIYSKHPFLDKGTISFEGYGAPAVWADVKLNEKNIIRIYSIHLHSNHINTNAIDKVAEGKIQKKETWLDLKGMIGKYKRTTAVRAKQAATIAKHIATSPYPVVLGGDLNEPSQSYVYELLSKKMKDAFIEQGQGIGTTYAGKIPFLRIDHILVDHRLNIHKHETLRMPFSDHYPIISTIGY